MQLQEPDNTILTQLRDVFKDDAGRRIFAHMLREYIVDLGGKPVEITKHSYDVVSVLITRALSEMNLDNGADFISGKYFLQVLLWYLLGSLCRDFGLFTRPIAILRPLFLATETL